MSEIMVCGHPTTDGTEEHFSIVQYDDAENPVGWCWWGHGWVELAKRRLCVVREGATT